MGTSNSTADEQGEHVWLITGLMSPSNHTIYKAFRSEPEYGCPCLLQTAIRLTMEFEGIISGEISKNLSTFLPLEAQ